MGNTEQSEAQAQSAGQQQPHPYGAGVRTMPVEPEQFCPAHIRPEDEEFKRQLYEILAMPPSNQMPAFTKLLGIAQYTVNFVGIGFVDVPYMARLTRKDFEMLHIPDPQVQNKLLVAGLILNSDPNVYAYNQGRRPPWYQQPQITTQQLRTFREEYERGQHLHFQQHPQAPQQNQPTQHPAQFANVYGHQQQQPQQPAQSAHIYGHQMQQQQQQQQPAQPTHVYGHQTHQSQQHPQHTHAYGQPQNQASAYNQLFPSTPTDRPMPTPPACGQQQAYGSVGDYVDDKVGQGVASAANNAEVQRAVGSWISQAAANPETQKTFGNMLSSQSDNSYMKYMANNPHVQSAVGSTVSAAAKNPEIQRQVGASVANAAQDKNTRAQLYNVFTSQK